MQFSDVRKQVANEEVIVPVATDAKAESPEQAVQVIAQETGIPAAELQAF